jgi:OOP family OmpA-OmpF porin
MRSRGAAALAGAVVVASATIALAERAPNRLEVSGFIGVDYFGDDIELGNSWAPEQKPSTAAMLGARLAWIALPDLTGNGDDYPHFDLGVELEGKLAVSYTGGSFSAPGDGGRPSYFAPVIGWRAHLLARVERVTASLSPHVVVGGGGETVASTSPYMADDTDGVVYYGVGAAWAVSRRWAVRLDARHGFTPGRMDSVTQTFELQLGAGARWELAPARPVTPRIEDADDDGIADADDRCPNEPETRNAFEDRDGCPDDPDQDGDGLGDAKDRCPWDPEDVNSIDDDDGCPDDDNDGDGILGSRDACRDAAEDRDGFQDADGCPDPDNDGDGIADTHDVCPMEPEVWNGIVDDDGCKDELPPKVKAFEGTLRGINFKPGKATILKSSRKTLARTLAIMREYPGLRVKIDGHTDDRGARDKNLDLSRRRADAVKWYLIDLGIAEDRIETEGFGPDQPVADNKGPKGRAKNRRIELHVLPVPQPGAPATQPSAPATQPSAPK